MSRMSTMIFLYSTLLLWGIGFEVLASPFSPAPLFLRDDSSPAINATITDHSGHDITPSFEIMVYHEPENVSTASNLTDRRRRQAATLSRPIMDCQTPGAVFVDSVCTYEDGEPLGMQGWEMSCYLMMDYFHPDTGKYHATFPMLNRRNGHCNDDEICVDGLGRGRSRHGEHSVATCVSTLYFIRMISNSGKFAGERQPLSDLQGKQARMMVSKADGSTPMEVDTFDVEAVDASGNKVQSQKCRDCMELKTDTFGPRTDGLRAEATLLTTGAVAGILWLAVLSG